MEAERFELHVIHSNDLHSHLECCASISGYIRHIRAAAGTDHVIALDLGDHADRMHPVTEGTQGLVNVAVINRTGYDLITIGNNEGLLFDREQLASLYKEHAEVPVICANLFDADTGRLAEWAVPYQIVRRGPLNIGWIGLTVDFQAFYTLLGWHAADPFQVLPDLIRELRPQVDLLMIASHLGVHADRRMADEMDGIDAIFGSHTHHSFQEPERRGNTYLFAAGKFGQCIGHATFHWDLTQGSLVSVAGKLLPLEGLSTAPDPEIDQLIEWYAQEADRVMEQPVAMLSERLDLDWFRESPLPNLTAHALRHYARTSISLVNHGVCLTPLEAGQVSRRQLLACCPSPINPCVLYLSGRQIRQALEQAADESHQQKELHGYGFRGKVLGTLAVDGLTIHVNRQAPPGRRIIQVFTDQGCLDDEQEYAVATIDVFTFGAGYPTLGAGRSIQYIVPDLLREWLAEAAGSQALIDGANVQHWVETDEERTETAG